MLIHQHLYDDFCSTRENEVMVDEILNVLWELLVSEQSVHVKTTLVELLEVRKLLLIM